MTKIVSFGGGVNSTALLIGIYEFNQNVDYIIFADTGGEKPETYEHINFMQNWCKEKLGKDIKIVKNEKITLENDCLNRCTLPSKAFGFGTCSHRFKIEPQEKFIKDNKIENYTWLIGFHFDEQKRINNATKFRNNVDFPLYNWGWNQHDCEMAILRNKIKLPVKSSCFFCPSMKKKEVLELQKTNPDLTKRAIEMEELALEFGNLKTVKGLGRYWSWKEFLNSKNQESFKDEQVEICNYCVDW